MTDFIIQNTPSAVQLPINSQSGSSYAIANSDRGKLILFTGSTSPAWTIAQAGAASAFLSNWVTTIKNTGTGTITLTPTTSTIEGCIKAFIPPGCSFSLYSDGSNYSILDSPVNQPLHGCFWGYGLDNITQSLAANVLNAGNQDIVILYETQLKHPWSLGRVSLQITAGAANGYINFGFYDTAGNLLVDSGAVDATTNHTVTNVIASTNRLLFMPGVYNYCQLSHASPTVQLLTGINTTGAANTVGLHAMYSTFNTASNLGTSSQSLPPTTGVTTLLATALNCAACLWEN